MVYYGSIMLLVSEGKPLNLRNRKRLKNMKKLQELIYDQTQLVKYMNNSKTREERFFYKREIDVIEELINKTREQLNLD